jgi:hypothetical protein
MRIAGQSSREQPSVDELSHVEKNQTIIHGAGTACCASGRRSLLGRSVVAYRSMNVLDLFSGIGGFSLGLERAGMRTVAFCERDEYCRAVLRKHWPDVPCFDDIHAIDADGLDRLGESISSAVASLVSPSASQESRPARKTTATSGRRCAALLHSRDPTWVIGENVAGLIAMALDDVLSDLEAIGYTARTFVIPAAAVGAPHRRDRALDHCYQRQQRTANQLRAVDAEEVAKLLGIAANTDRERLEGRDSEVLRERGAERPAWSRVHLLPTPTASRRDGLQSHGVNVVSGSLNPQWVEWLMGFPDGWTALDASEMPSSRKSSKKSAEPSCSAHS